MKKEINALHRAEKKEVSENLQEGANKLLSATLLSAIVGVSGFCYHQHNKLVQTESKLEETTKELTETKYKFKNTTEQSENNYDLLLREVVRKEASSYPWHLYFSDDKNYAEIISGLTLERKPTNQEFKIILDEVKNYRKEFYNSGGAK
ncbi:hypothetical protein HZA97_07160 [Candidatus Woesearchaeota archaeon]|nr:hypothetical protein [Candidatus Woesearchaeota archaeon]